jgi:NTE family protein
MADPSSLAGRRVALVLGGGGLKGFAHIGVLRALHEYGVQPAVCAGTSIGSLIAAAFVSGVRIPEMERRALALRRRDLFRINHMGMLLERMHSRSIYLGEPLRELCEASAPDKRFDELPIPLLVNTVDVERGSQVIWGLPGLRDVSVLEAVYASCALPGFFPPGEVAERVCVDGGVTDNLPVAAAAHGMDAVIAVDVGTNAVVPMRLVRQQGFAALYMRSAQLMMHALQLAPLTRYAGPPMILVRPRVAHVPWLSFAHTADLIAEGYRAGIAALQHLTTCLAAPGGVFPRRTVHVRVNREKCIGCGLCVALAPEQMAMDEMQKAYPREELVDWSPADGDFVHHCPTLAIEATPTAPGYEMAT